MEWVIPSVLIVAVLGMTFKNTADINKIKGKICDNGE